MLFAENTFGKPSGQLTFYLHKGGKLVGDRIVGGELIEQRIVENLITDSASLLMASRMAPGAVTGGSANSRIGNFRDRGLQYLAVGVGQFTDPDQPYDEVTNPVDVSAWNPLDPPPEALSDTKLTGEIFRKEWDTWCFVDVDGSETDNLTNILKLTTVFLEDEANGPLSECGIFGGDATSAANSGIMFNHKCFKVVSKSAEMRLSICWRLTF